MVRLFEQFIAETQAPAWRLACDREGLWSRSTLPCYAFRRRRSSMITAATTLTTGKVAGSGNT